MKMKSSEFHFYLFTFHVFSSCLYVGNIYYEHYYITTPGSQSYGGRWKYLTYLNEVLQCIYFLLATLGDLMLLWLLKKRKKESSIVRARDFLFAVFAFPTAMLVSVNFWIIYAIDRELIYPTYLDSMIPAVVNHIWHTACSVLMIVEAVVDHHEYPATKNGLLGLFIYGSLYFLWMTWQAYFLSMWPYSFLDSFTIYQHCAFFFTCQGLVCSFYFAGKSVTILRTRLSNGPKKLKV